MQRILLLAFVVSLIVTCVLIYHYHGTERGEYDEYFSEASKKVQDAVRNVDQHLRQLMPATEPIADELSHGTLDHS